MLVISSVSIEIGTRIDRVGSPCFVGLPAPGFLRRGLPFWVNSVMV
jgi:hypothetical protein